MKIVIPDLKSLKKFAKSFVKALNEPLFIALYGTLGSGKTTLVRAILQDLLGSDEDIPSPTFTLIQTYESSRGEVWHCDLYRLEEAEDIIEIGLMEAIGTYACFVEWPEKMGHYLPGRRLDIWIEITGNEERLITLSAHDEKSEQFLKRLDHNNFREAIRTC